MKDDLVYGSINPFSLLMSSSRKGRTEDILDLVKLGRVLEGDIPTSELICRLSTTTLEDRLVITQMLTDSIVKAEEMLDILELAK